MRVERWLVVGSAVLYLASLAMPAIVGTGFPALSGMDVLRQGAGAWRDGIVAWYANPMLVLALVTSWLRLYRIAFTVAVVGLGVGLSSFSAEWAAESGGRSVPPFEFAAGFYVWVAAFVVACTSPLVGYIRSRSAGLRLS